MARCLWGPGRCGIRAESWGHPPFGGTEGIRPRNAEAREPLVPELRLGFPYNSAESRAWGKGGIPGRNPGFPRKQRKATNLACGR